MESTVLRKIIPESGISQIRKMASSFVGKVQVSLYKNDIVVKAGTEFLRIATIDEKYPDYQRVIPKSSAIALLLDRMLFLQAVRRVKVVSDGESPSIAMELSEGKMTLSAKSENFGEASDFLDVDYSGEPVRIGFNPGYLIDALLSIRSETVKMEMGAGIHPTVFRPTNNDRHLALVMPLVA